MSKRPLTPVENRRSRLTAELFAGFRRLLGEAKIHDLTRVNRPSRLPGMAELRDRHGLTQKTFANWWVRYRQRDGNSRVHLGGRPRGPSAKSATSQGAKWFSAMRASLFPQDLRNYTTAEILSACAAAHGAPFSTSKQLRRVLAALGESSRDMERHAKQSARKKNRAKYERRKLREATEYSASRKEIRGESTCFFGVNFGRLPKPPLEYFEGGFARPEVYVWQGKRLELWLGAGKMVELSNAHRFQWHARDYIGFGRTDMPGAEIFAFDRSGAVFKFPLGQVGQQRAVQVAPSWSVFRASLRPAL